MRRMRTICLCGLLVLANLLPCCFSTSFVKHELKGLACVKLHVSLREEPSRRWNISSHKMISSIKGQIVASAKEKLSEYGLQIGGPGCDAWFIVRIRLLGGGDPGQYDAALVTIELREPARITRLGQDKDVVVIVWRDVLIVEIADPSKLKESLTEGILLRIGCFGCDLQTANSF